MSDHSYSIIGWILAGILGLFNLIAGSLVIPIRTTVNETKEDLQDCKLKRGERMGKIEGKLYHVNQETERQRKCLDILGQDLTEIKERTVRTEANIVGIVETNKRIECNIAKLANV